MNDGQYVKRIILEAKAPTSRQPIVVREEDGYEITHWGVSEPYRMQPSTMSIENINLGQWTVTFETDYPDDFKKVAAVVGTDKAAEVLTALKKPVPEDWESASRDAVPQQADEDPEEDDFDDDSSCCDRGAC